MLITVVSSSQLNSNWINIKINKVIDIYTYNLNQMIKTKCLMSAFL